MSRTQRRGARALRDRMVSFALTMALLALGAVTIGAARPSSAQRFEALRVAVGETAALVDAAVLVPELRDALSAEVSMNPRLRLSAPGAASVVLRGSITRLERTAMGARSHVRCEISLIVADRRGGSVRAMLRGRASAQGTPGRSLDRAVIRAAVRGALGSLDRGVVRP